MINTAYIERLNATFRERLASLTRRGRALARRPLTLQHGMYLIGSVYNFCTYHASLRLAASAAGMPCLKRIPAMAAGITDHCWTVQETAVVSGATATLDTPQAAWAPLACAETPSREVVLVTTVNCRASLEHGLRVVQTNTLMGYGLYNTPMGAFLPSILY